MSSEETFELNFRMDFGAVGHQPVTVIGTAKDVGQQTLVIETKIRSCVVHVLSADQTQMLKLDITHLLDRTSQSDIHERIEKRFEEYLKHQREEAVFDFDSEGAIA